MSASLASSLIFILALGAILWEKLDRTIVALVGAAVMVGVGTWMGFYNEHAAIESIDFETLGLLFGMMTIVSLLRPTGAFEFLATSAAKLSRGRPIVLLLLLGGITSVLSMLLDNVTTIVLIAPVTILITEILGLSPIPFLIAEALLSNTAGVGTLIGDPPNILIGSAAGLTFNDFLTHSFPMVVIAWLGVMGLLLLLFRKDLVQPANTAQVLQRLNPAETLKDLPSARKLSLILVFTVLLFFLQSFLGLTSSFIAMSMAALALLLLRPSVEHVFERIEWSVLIFFGALFVMAGGLEASGALSWLEALILRASMGNPIITTLLVLWLAAIASSLVDNIPITIAIIPVIQHLESQGVQVMPLWWALAFGAGFGGNGTIIGSTANVVAVQLTKRMDNPITSIQWMRYGIPVMLLSGIIASIYLALAYPLFLK
jgi:Na+/H+ antiporter NhaD/arsenite permease-like protein